MGYGLMVYAVELDKVRAAVGSDDEKLRRQLGGRFKRDIASADDWFSSEIAGGCPPRYEAIRHLIHGQPRVEGYAFQYAYAFKHIVEFYGKFLPNNGFAPISFDYLEQVGRALNSLGVTALSVEPLAYFNPPIELPRPDDFPGVGYVELPALTEALAQLDALGDGRAAAFQGAGDSFLATSLENVYDWCSRCVAQQRGLISFYH